MFFDPPLPPATHSKNCYMNERQGNPQFPVRMFGHSLSKSIPFNHENSAVQQVSVISPRSVVWGTKKEMQFRFKEKAQGHDTCYTKWLYTHFTAATPVLSSTQSWINSDLIENLCLSPHNVGANRQHVCKVILSIRLDEFPFRTSVIDAKETTKFLNIFTLDCSSHS